MDDVLLNLIPSVNPTWIICVTGMFMALFAGVVVFIFGDMWLLNCSCHYKWQDNHRLNQ